MDALPRRKHACDANKPPKFVVIGGGIAGVSCAQELRRLSPYAEVIILTESDTIVAAASIFKVTAHLDELTVYERSTDSFSLENPGIQIKKCTVLGVDYESRQVHVRDISGTYISAVPYDKLCLCVGARPRLIAHHPRVIGLRDQQSVEDLLQRLRTASRVAVVGNGGIALELIHELRFCAVDWIVKDSYIGSAFFDASASAFILPSLHARAQASDSTPTERREEDKGAIDGDAGRVQDSGNVVAMSAALPPAEVPSSSSRDSVGAPRQTAPSGSALGPEWIAKTAARAFLQYRKHLADAGELKLHFQQEVSEISTDGGITWGGVLVGTPAPPAPYGYSPAEDGMGTSPLLLRTTTGEVVACDFVVSATGVEPQNTAFLHSLSVEQLHTGEGGRADLNMDGEASPSLPVPPQRLSLQCSAEGYICTDSEMRTSVPGVYAAGDCCQYDALPSSATASTASSHFFHMRLWTQAHWMGVYAAQSMLGRTEDFAVDTKFELFTHITRFFGYKVVMLGRYNAQGLGHATEVVTRQMVVTDDGVKLLDADSSGGASGRQSTPSTSSSTSSRVSTSTAPVAPGPVEIWVRVTPGREYVKLTTLRGRLVGALLIGDTDLEETCENLILNALDISGIGIALLDPDVDIADYFD